MNRKANIYNNGILAGVLEKTDTQEYVFVYTDSYFNSNNDPAIALSIPKKQQKHSSKNLFPFFCGLLSEGINKQIQCRLLHIDENDSFSLLLSTATQDTIGAITVKEITP